MPSYPVAKLFGCQVVQLPSYPDTKWSRCQVLQLPSCPVVQLPSYPIFKLSSCQFMQLPSYPATNLSSYKFSSYLASHQGPVENICCWNRYHGLNYKKSNTIETRVKIPNTNFFSLKKNSSCFKDNRCIEFN